MLAAQTSAGLGLFFGAFHLGEGGSAHQARKGRVSITIFHEIVINRCKPSIHEGFSGFFADKLSKTGA